MKKTILISLVFVISGLVTQLALSETNNSTINTQKQAQSWLGIWIENIPASLGNHLLPILKKDQGILIKKISPDSPAAKVGLQHYDIISKFNDQEIFSQQQLTKLIRATQPETTINLSIVRQGKLMAQEVMLAALPGRNLIPDKSNSHPKNVLPHSGTWHPLPPPSMNKPFFNSELKRELNKYFSRNYNKRLHQEMHQMRQQMNQLQQQMNQQGQQNSWSQFESIQIESTGENKHRAEVKYEDSEGNKKEFVFEGNLNEIQQQIMAQDNMDEDKKQNLLQALDMNNSYPLPFRQNNFMAPDWFNQPSPRPNWFPYNQ